MMKEDIQKTDINTLQKVIENISEQVVREYFSVTQINEKELFNIIENVSKKIIDEKF